MEIIKVVRPRVYVPNGYEWSRSVGTDYFAVFGPESFDATAGNANNLAEAGWTTTSLTQTAGSAADMGSSSDSGVPMHILMDTAADLVDSPAIFGDYAHMLVVKEILGYLPTKLHLKFYAAFLTASNDEAATGIGWVEDGGAPNVANDHAAAIRSDGTNFILRSDADSDTGAAIDTSWHTWEIVSSLGGTTDAIEWFIDGTSQGTIDAKADEYPVSFGAGVLASTGANDIGLSWVHIYYR